MSLSIATCTYSEFRPEMGIPIRSTVGRVKWFSYFPYGTWQNITPEPWMLNMSYDRFREKYRQKLDRIGFDTLLGDAQALQAELGDDWEFPEQLVVLCFDNLAKPGTWCHRTMFAEWMGENGMAVRELGRSRPAPPADDPQGSLW